MGRSADTGSTVTFGQPGAWSQVANPATNASVPNWVKDILAQPGNSAMPVFTRSVSASITGGAGGVPNSSVSGAQYWAAQTGCTLTTCGAPNIDVDNFVATQGGVAVTQNNVQFNQTPVILRGQTIYQDSWIAQGNMAASTWHGLQNSYIGQYSDQSLSFLVTGLNSSGDPVTGPISGSVTTGYFHGGNATPAADMTSLKTSNVQATYSGYFRGMALQSGPMTSIDGGPGTATQLGGNLSMNANFGSGAVNGNISNIQRPDPASTSGGGIVQPYGITMTGTMNGANYSGTAQYTDPTRGTGTAAIAGGPTGQMIGGFYGANAAETAGTVRITGTAPGTGPGTGANTTLIGGFGGRR